MNKFMHFVTYYDQFWIRPQDFYKLSIFIFEVTLNNLLIDGNKGELKITPEFTAFVFGIKVYPHQGVPDVDITWP